MSIKKLLVEHEGASLEGSMHYPPGGGDEPYATVMVFHDAMGLSPFTHERAKRLAELGFLAVAVDMYGDAVYCENPDDAGQYYMQFHDNPDLLPSRLAAWYDTVRQLEDVDSSRLGAIGYCFGGQCVLGLVRLNMDIKAAISFHGILKADKPATPKSMNCNVAVYTGSKDPWVPKEDIDTFSAEFVEAGATLSVTEFAGVYHGFTNPGFVNVNRPGIKYDELADKVSWAGMLALLKFSLSV